MTSYSERALSTLHEWVQSEVLRKHCYAVAASMRHFAQLNDADSDLWGAVGLLHDLDFERYPQMPPPGELPAVKKKMKDKAFARAVNREDITRGAEGLDMPIDDLIQQVIAALRAAAPQLGLQGVDAG